jgi:hypothetical protein
MQLTSSHKPLDISTAMRDPTVLKQRIQSIGIELEGGWKKLPEGVRLVHDGSVHFEEPPMEGRELELYNGIQTGTYNPYGNPDQQAIYLAAATEYQKLNRARIAQIPKHIGELPSLPMNLTEDRKPSDRWKEWLKLNYPSSVNDSCGMHVHMAMRTAGSYQRTMVPEYVQTVREEFKKWADAHLPAGHHIHSRLAGESRYCQPLFFADKQARTREKDPSVDSTRGKSFHRYTMINWCYLRHGTVECRLLPMMPDKDIAQAAIEHLINITNAFIATVGSNLRKSIQARHEEILTATIAADESGHREVINLCV